MFLSSVKGALDLNYSIDVICQGKENKKENNNTSLIPRLEKEERGKVEENVGFY